MKHPSTSHQRGVFTIITAIGAVLLVVILGFVVDGTRLMVIQGELQNATDACALAAAGELNGQLGATFRAAAVGSKVGGALNKKNFQATSVAIAPSDVKFSTSLNGIYVEASGSSVNYRFAQCTATHSGWINLFMGLVGLGTDEPTTSSKAGQQQTRKVCVLPLAVVKDSLALGTLNISDLKITNFDAAVSLKTASQYGEMITGFGSCGVPTDRRLISIGSDTTLADMISDPVNSPLRSRYNDAIAGSSGKQLIAVPWIRALDQPINSWVCLELGLDGPNLRITYRGDINNTLHPFSNRCMASGVGGFGAIGPFTPVLVK